MNNNDDVLNSIEEAGKRAPSVPETMPVLPLRDIVIFPHMIFPVLIGRASSLKAVAQSLERDKYVMLVSQHQSQTDEPVSSTTCTNTEPLPRSSRCCDSQTTYAEGVGGRNAPRPCG